MALYADLRGVESMFMDLMDNPQMYVEAAGTIIDNQIRFARAQVAAGADMIGVGDAVASLVSPQMYEQFVLPFEKRLFDAIHEAGAAVKLHICGDVTNSVGLMAKTGCDVLDLDWMVPLKESRRSSARMSRSAATSTPRPSSCRARRRTWRTPPPSASRGRPAVHRAAGLRGSAGNPRSRTSAPSAPAMAA